jgi:phasin family protein
MAAGADAAEKHAEFARNIFGYATKNTREIEELANQSSKEAGRIFRERLKALFDEIGAGRDIMAD